MNKEIQLLYSIFQHELKPPFKVVEDPGYPFIPDIYNTHSEYMGNYSKNNKRLRTEYNKDVLILSRIKRIYNIDELSNDDVYHIAKHLVNWIQDKISVPIISVQIHNIDGSIVVIYP